MPNHTDSNEILFVWPGDLHLETADRENYRVSKWMVDEVNNLIQPDFVQFAGDNVQHATTEQFQLFNGLCRELTVPWYPLVGDHDVHHDPQASAYQSHVGELYGAFSRNGFRFIRLDTMEFKPQGMSPQQLLWFQFQVDSAVAAGERIVIFQHHYPYQILEDFTGSGMDKWREIVSTRPIAAIFAGHTHYGQIANDGRNVTVATRSIGDPEGGPAGYSIIHLHNDELAVIYRSVADTGPIAMITSPRDVITATAGKHVITGPTEFRVRTWSSSPVERAQARIDGGQWLALDRSGNDRWKGSIPGDLLSKGEHDLEVEVVDRSGETGRTQIRFMVDRSGRYTAFPRVRPEVLTTKFC